MDAKDKNAHVCPRVHEQNPSRGGGASYTRRAQFESYSMPSHLTLNKAGQSPTPPPLPNTLTHRPTKRTASTVHRRPATSAAPRPAGPAVGAAATTREAAATPPLPVVAAAVAAPARSSRSRWTAGAALGELDTECVSHKHKRTRNSRALAPHARTRARATHAGTHTGLEGFCKQTALEGISKLEQASRGTGVGG